MFTIKYRDPADQIEMLYGDVVSTSFNKGILTAHIANGQAVQFGPNYNPLSLPQAFVMNEAGATVGVYEFHYIAAPLDAEALQMLGAAPEPKPNRRARRAAAKKPA